MSEPEVLERIRLLAVPPAWNDVWICPWPNGHIQATGIDAAGRKQYLYHDDWHLQQARRKFDHVLRQHADVGSDHVLFQYVAKHNKERQLVVPDPQVRDLVAELERREGGGQELLAWRQGTEWVDVRSGDINDYIAQISENAFTAKDFRTWHATVLAAVGLAVSWAAASRSPSARRKAVTRVVREVAGYLGNTPAVARSSYIDPRVIDAFEEGRTVREALEMLGSETPMGHPASQGHIEAAVVELLQGRRARRAA